jgi:CRP/FNR family transcriptional regulator, nitrogen oxide reductase regulator
MRPSCANNSVENESPIRSYPVAEPLHSVFLEGLSKPEVRSILAAATVRRFAANSVIAQQEGPADYFFLLRTGCARIFYITQQGRKVLLRWLLPGEIMGGAALLAKPYSYLVGTEMVKSGSAFVWHRNTIRDFATRYPKLLDNALRVAAEYLTWFVAAHMALVSTAARERLAHVLLSLAQGIGRRVPGGIQLDITNEQLANTANITLFTASRFLSEWQRSGALEKSRGSLTVCDPRRLFPPPNLI